MALGDPIGPVEDLSAAISAFKAYCARNDWQPSFIYILPEGRAEYRSNGFDVTSIAYEAIVELASFTLEGRDNRDVRQHYNKNARLGYQARFYPPPLDDEILHELRRVSDDWLSTQFGGEKYFLVGWFNDDYVRNSPVMAVHTPGGKVVAFANLVSTKNKSEITCDLVRFCRNTENGMAEFLIVSMMKWAISQGYTTFSLSAITTYGKGMEEDDPPVAKIILVISSLINSLYKFTGLYKFKDKFHPLWEPRYIAYPGATTLLPSLTTMLRLYSGENARRRYMRRS